MKQLMNEKRNLENTINNKNKEIETLNLKVQKMTGFHDRAISKLEDQLDEVKKQHTRWLERQEKETAEWCAERKELNEKIDNLNKSIQDIKRKNQERENKLTEDVNQKGLEIAELKGTIQELENKIKQLASKNLVEVGNVEKTMLETKTLMNTEKEKLLDTTTKEKHLTSE